MHMLYIVYRIITMAQHSASQHYNCQTVLQIWGVLCLGGNQYAC